MPTANADKSSIPPNTASSLNTFTTRTGSTNVQTGPYTKTQFQNTMKDSRSVKDTKEIERLLHDYPTALDLYRTGKYRVKVKYDADIERVILIEKRSSKTTSNTVTNVNDRQENNQSSPNVSTNQEEIDEISSKEYNSKELRSRTQSQDHSETMASVPDNNLLDQSTTSSMRMMNNTQPKVDHHRTKSRDRETSVVSSIKQKHGNSRSRSRDSLTNISQLKQESKRNTRDQPKAIVPYMNNVNPTENIFQQSRTLQHYFSNPILRQQQPRPSNIYTPSTFFLQQNSLRQRPYYHNRRPAPALVYPKPSAYPKSSTIKSTANVTNTTVNATNKCPSSYQTYYQNQQQYIPVQSMYHSRPSYRVPLSWPTVTSRRINPMINNKNSPKESQQGSKQRARSVDTGPRSYPSISNYNQHQTTPTTFEQTPKQHQYYYYHRFRPSNEQVHDVVASTDPMKEQAIPWKETNIEVKKSINVEKLTIRRLNEYFLRKEPSGRLPYELVPNILKHFGISLKENELTSAAQDLQYNINEPISARHLVYVLIKLGKIAKSTDHERHPRSMPSPAMLPEDREIANIMTQHKVPPAHIYSSAYSHYWY